MSTDPNDCSCERFSTISFYRIDDPTCPYHHGPEGDARDE